MQVIENTTNYLFRSTKFIRSKSTPTWEWWRISLCPNIRSFARNSSTPSAVFGTKSEPSCPAKLKLSEPLNAAVSHSWSRLFIVGRTISLSIPALVDVSLINNHCTYKASYFARPCLLINVNSIEYRTSVVFSRLSFQSLELFNIIAMNFVSDNFFCLLVYYLKGR